MNFIKLLSGDTEITHYDLSCEDYLLAAEKIKSEGFHVQRKGSIVPCIFDMGKTGARVWTHAPVSGRYYIALQVRDTFGTYDEEYIPVADSECGVFEERLIELSVGEKIIGTFRYGRDDKKYYFFVTEEAISLKEGEEITYKVLSGDRALFTSIVLMKQRPHQQTNRIMNLTTDNGEVRFWTTVACRARIIIGEHVFSEETHLNNHRFTIPEELWGVRFVLELCDEEGNILCGRGTCRRKEMTESDSKAINVALNYSKNYDDLRPKMAVLPLGKGELYSAGDVNIFDEEGNGYPAQTKITSRWNDGSIRTAALTANLLADGKSFFIKNEKVKKPEEIFAARYDGNGIVVETENGTYHFNNENDSVLPDRKLIAVLYDVKGNRYTACGGKFEIEEQGINHIVIKRINRFMCGDKRSMKCLTHLHFYRGIKAYKLEFGFENDIMENEFCTISGMYLEADEGADVSTDVFQLDENTFIENGVELEKRCDGRFRMFNEPMIVEDFWQNYPKGFSADKSSSKIGICPFITQPERYRDDDIIAESRLFFYLKTGNYEFHGGMRKYHSILFGEDAEKLSDIQFLSPDPKKVEESAAFGRVKCDCPDFTKYDEYMENSLELYYEHNKSFRDYGMMNYGDSFGEGNIHWTNLEYDFHYGLMLHFLRTGDDRFYQLAKIGAAHYAEIDTCHRSVRFDEDGYYFVHTVGHANNYYHHEKIKKGYPKIKFQMGHMFNHGLAAFYMLTGIERYKETVEACANTLAKYYTTKFDFLTEREPGWCMIALEAAYELTLDEYYLNACRIIVERVLVKQDKETGCVKYMMELPKKEGEDERKFCYGGKSFMHGVLGSAMKYFYLLTGDERVKESAIKIGEWLCDVMYDDELKEFWYSSPFREIEKRVSQPETSIEVLDAVLFACLEGEKKEYLEIARKAFEKMLESPYRFDYDVGKVFAMRLRFSPEIMYDYAKAREKYFK